MDIVEIEGEPVGKRGKMSGAKQVWRDLSSCRDTVLPLGSARPSTEVEAMMVSQIERGRLVDPVPSARQIRDYVLAQLPVVAAEIMPG